MGAKDHSHKRHAGNGKLSYAPIEAIRRVLAGNSRDPIVRAELLADLCRLNTLYMIMQAGSGHIGSSFSSLDVISWLWTASLVDANSGAPDADTYFSSKGHDAPALYALLIALRILDFDLLHRLRRLGGLPGHPDVEATPFIATNTGSLGMGISKAYGMARARRFAGRRGRIVLMTGDGELQEGQIWESLQPAANERLSEIIAIVDHNKLQSDSSVAAVEELTSRIDERLARLGKPPLSLASAPLPVRIAPAKPEKLVLAYGDELLQMARTRPEIVVMDADLLSDCGIEAFKAELPERFLECGIAEQHMVSAAGGLALEGMLPVVHSFACFLSTRANEQIYNNATEKTKIIYTATL